VVGPALCRLWYSTIRFLERHVAGSNEFLRIRHRDGTIEHVRGPTVLFENPVHHIEVVVAKAISLPTNSSHLVVIRSLASKDAAAAPSREIKSGPLLFFPEAMDGVQVFDWADKGGGALSVDLRVVNVGTTITRSLSCHVQSADNHSATMNVSLRVKLAGINEALAIQDPIGEGDSATKSEVLTALQGMRFGHLNGSLLEHVRAAVSAEKFAADLAAELRQRAACELVSVSVSSAEPSEALLQILKQEDDVAGAKVRDQIADSNLAAASARQDREQALEQAKQKHELKLAAERHQAELAQHDLEARRHLDNMKELRGLGVDLTQYLCHGPRSQLAAASRGSAQQKTMGFLCL